MDSDHPTTTYRLPDDLGGWPVRVVDVWAMGMDVRAFITEGPYKDSWITLRPRKLVAVAPPLPPEPPAGSVVRALMPDEDEPWIFERANNSWGDGGWYNTGQTKRYVWAALCQRGTPVLLVPDPFHSAPKLPWRAPCATNQDGSLVVCEPDGSDVPVVIPGHQTVYLNAVQAQDAARALWVAAAALRATTESARESR